MTAPSMLPRGVYIAPYLDQDSRPVILIIDGHRRCLHSFAMERGERERDALERGQRLLSLMDSPSVNGGGVDYVRSDSPRFP